MKKNILMIVGAIILLVIGIYAFTSINSGPASTGSSSSIESTNSGSTGNSVETANTRVINIDAQRWSYSPNEITVKQGEHIKLVLNNIDFAHGIVIPDLGVGGIDSVEFTADKVGTYTFRCPTPCGEGHRMMTGTLVVEA